jgi:hypothetical protein
VPANAVPTGLQESEQRRRMQGMIRALLAERFKLVMRVEQKNDAGRRPNHRKRKAESPARGARRGASRRRREPHRVPAFRFNREQPAESRVVDDRHVRPVLHVLDKIVHRDRPRTKGCPPAHDEVLAAPVVAIDRLRTIDATGFKTTDADDDSLDREFRRRMVRGTRRAERQADRIHGLALRRRLG